MCRAISTILFTIIFSCCYLVNASEEEQLITIECKITPNAEFVTIQHNLKADLEIDLAAFERAVEKKPKAITIGKWTGWVINLFSLPAFYKMGSGFGKQIDAPWYGRVFFGTTSTLGMLFLGGEAGMRWAEILLPEDPELSKYLRNRDTVEIVLDYGALATATVISAITSTSLAYVTHEKFNESLGKAVYALDIGAVGASTIGFVPFQYMVGQVVASKVSSIFVTKESFQEAKNRKHLLELLYGLKNNLSLMSETESKKLLTFLNRSEEGEKLLNMLNYEQQIVKKTSRTSKYELSDKVVLALAVLSTVSVS